MKHLRLLFAGLLIVALASCSDSPTQQVTGPGGGVDDTSRKGDQPDSPSLVTEDFSGPTHVGVILVNFANTPEPFTPTDEAQIMDFMFNDTPGAYSVSNLFDEMSFGQDNFTGEIIGTYNISWENSNPCPGSSSQRFAWNREAFDSATVDPLAPELTPENFGILVYMYSGGNGCDNPNFVNGEAYRKASWPILEIAEVGIYAWEPTVATTAHEIGHLKGWGHSGVPGTHPADAYGDFSCIMGNNWTTDPPIKRLAMRQASVVWKTASGYIDSVNVRHVTQPGAEVVHLASTARSVGAFPAPPPGETMYHAVRVDAGTGPVYWVSFRRAADSNFDSNPALLNIPEFASLMDRVHIHDVSGTRLAVLDLTNPIFVGEDVTIEALGDGTSGEDSVSVEVTINSLHAPDMIFDPPYYITNNQSLGVAPETYTLTVTNVDDPGTGTATIDLTGVGESGLFTVDVTPSQLQLEPGASGNATVTMDFSAVPDDGLYKVGVTATDPSGQRTPKTAYASYYVDATGPNVPTNFAGSVAGLTVTLTWQAPGGSPASYEIMRDGVIIGSSTALSYVDDTVVAGETYNYRVRALDFLGNPSGWSSVVTLTIDCANGFDSQVTPLVVYHTQPMGGAGLAATYTLSIENLDGLSCAPTTYTVNGNGLPVDYILGAASPTVGPGDTENVDINLSYFPDPPFPATPPSQVHLSFTIQVTETGIETEQHTVDYYYDTVAPTTPGSLDAVADGSGVTLTWTASADATSGVKEYEVFREGVSLGTTTALTFFDPTVASSCTTYDVVARDNAGLESSPASTSVTTVPATILSSDIVLYGPQCNYAWVRFTVDQVGTTGRVLFGSTSCGQQSVPTTVIGDTHYAQINVSALGAGVRWKPEVTYCGSTATGACALKKKPKFSPPDCPVPPWWPF